MTDCIYPQKLLGISNLQHKNLKEFFTLENFSCIPELQIRGGIEDNSKIIVLISQLKRML